MRKTLGQWALATVLVIGASIGWAETEASAAPVQGAITNGVCETFVGGRTIVVCVPHQSPSGAWLTKLWEDGSAAYADGSVFDPEDLNFR